MATRQAMRKNLREFHAFPVQAPCAVKRAGGLGTLAIRHFGKTNPFLAAPKIAVSGSYKMICDSERLQKRLASFWKRTHFDGLHQPIKTPTDEKGETACAQPACRVLNSGKKMRYDQ
jgi:hypothetical protein